MIHPRHLSRARNSFICLALVGALGLCAFAHAAAPPTTNPDNKGAPLVISGIDEQTGNIRLLVNKSVTVTTSRPYKRISVAQPDVADVNGISPTRILVRGVKAGSTQVIIWDEDDNSQSIDVLVQANLLQLRELYGRLMPQANIDIVDNDGVIALTGTVPTVNAADQAASLASGYGSKVLNLLEVSGGQQILLQIRFAEVSKTATSQLGVNLGYSDGRSFMGSNVGNAGNFSVRQSQNDPDASDLGITQTAADTVFGRALFNDVVLAYFVKALRDNNLLRVLAEPNLVAISGQEAEFLAGGDFPVPVVQGGTSAGSGTAISVQFREFGVKLNFLPVALGNGRVRLRLSPEVSDVDFTNAVLTQGFRIPGTRTRRLTTTVEMQEGETFAVGGLLDNRVAANKSVTPLLGDLPVLGALFRSVRYQRSETELVILVTPRLVKGLRPGEIPALPGEDWRHPSELGLFLNGDVGGTRDKTTTMPQPTRRYIGSYGFIPAESDPVAEEQK